jgi:hypothetical protein
LPATGVAPIADLDGTRGFEDLKAPAPQAFFRPKELEKPESVACSSCHAKIVEEWKATGHAIAWVDEEYKEQLKDKRKPESCYGCHIPKPLMQAELSAKPPPRDGDRHLGISCESCHLAADGVMLGPRGTPTSAHPTKKSDAFVGQGSSALCVSCHKVNIGPVLGIAKDFEQAHLAESGKSCVGCHCASVEQAFANASSGGKDSAAKEAASKTGGSNGGDDANPPVRKGRSHALQTPRDPTFLARAFEITAAVNGAKTVVSIKNAAGHRVPGLIGRKIELKAELIDAQGKPMGHANLAIDAENYLGVGETSTINLGGTAASVHVTGIEQDPRSSEPIKFLDASVTVAR